MEERNILSSEEVDAIIKAAQTASQDTDSAAPVDNSNINSNALNRIIVNLIEELEKKLSVLLRRKITITHNPIRDSKIEEFEQPTEPSPCYSDFKLDPLGSSLMTIIDADFISLTLNLLYGGKAQNSIENKIGNVGIITAEKIGSMIIDCLEIACAELSKFTHKATKSSLVLSTVNNIDANEKIYVVEFKCVIDEIDTNFKLLLPEEFLIKMIPVKTGTGKHKERDFWRSAIKSEVIDSYVTVSTVLPDIKIKLKEFRQLKVGDEIEISDPTIVYVRLSDLKLFRGLAGQSNAKMVVKIVGQI